MYCEFCEIIKGTVPAYIVYQDKCCICFFPKNPEVLAHTLIVPKKHFSDIYEIPNDILSCLISTVKKIAKHYQEVLNATGINLLHASGKDAQQSVLHFHFHLLPRFNNDGINTWPILPGSSENLDSLLNNLYLE